MKTVLVLGATSAIAEQMVRQYATEKCALILAGRNAGVLDSIAADAMVRGAVQTHVITADLADINAHAAVWQSVQDIGLALDAVVIAYGVLTKQDQAATDVAYLNQQITVNLTSAAALAERAAALLELQKGVLGVITSVAGMRGRQSSYAYSAAKAGLSVYLQGLRHKYAPRGVAVVDIRPGFVDTPMTAHLQKSLLWAQPAAVAVDCIKAINKRAAVCYTPWFWRWIMLIIVLLPNWLMHKTKM